jgi:hypothetical protein
MMNEVDMSARPASRDRLEVQVYRTVFAIRSGEPDLMLLVVPQHPCCTSFMVLDAKENLIGQIDQVGVSKPWTTSVVSCEACCELLRHFFGQVAQSDGHDLLVRASISTLDALTQVRRHSIPMR